jgi:hypothetical protein
MQDPLKASLLGNASFLTANAPIIRRLLGLWRGRATEITDAKLETLRAAIIGG